MPGKLSALNLDHSKMAAASMAGNMASGKLAGKVSAASMASR